MFWCAEAVAQTNPPLFQSPLSSQGNGDSERTPPFQQFQRLAPATFGPPTSAFVPPANGAGNTGFDSTNSRNKRSNQPRKPEAQSNIFAIEPPLPMQEGVPPTQAPPPASAAALDGSNTPVAATGHPGQPPVEIGPIRKPPRKRKSGEPDDPYAPLGVRAGSFLLYPALELIGGHDSTPGQVKNGRGAWLYTLAPELLARSDWSRHELKAALRGSYTGYSPDETPTLSRPYFNGRVDGRIDVRHDTNINLGTRVLVSTDNPGSPNLQAGLAKLPIYTTFGGNAGLAHRFNRFELSASLDAERTTYQHSVLTDGTTASNKDRNYDQVGGTLRGSYELLPGVKPFVQAGADRRTHDLETDSFGFKRDSKGLIGEVGSSFELTRQLTGEIALGYLRRAYDDPRLPDLEGFIGQGSLTWAATALTSVKMTAASTAGESTIPGVSGILYRDLGLQVDHALRRWLIFTAKAGMGFDEYVGDVRRDRRFSLGAGLTYKLSREVQVKGEVQENWLRSNVSGNDYNATVFLFGMRLQR